MLVARAFVVGLSCAILHNAIMIVGDWAGMHYAGSLAISFVILLVTGYQLHSSWTYKGTARGGASFGRYAFVAIGNYPLSLGGMFLFVDGIGLSVPVASPIVTVLMFGANLLGNRWALSGARANPVATPGRSADHR